MKAFRLSPITRRVSLYYISFKKEFLFAELKENKRVWLEDLPGRDIFLPHGFEIPSSFKVKRSEKASAYLALSLLLLPWRDDVLYLSTLAILAHFAEDLLNFLGSPSLDKKVLERAEELFSTYSPKSLPVVAANVKREPEVYNELLFYAPTYPYNEELSLSYWFSSLYTAAFLDVDTIYITEHPLAKDSHPFWDVMLMKGVMFTENREV